MSSAAQTPSAEQSEARLFALVCYGLYFAAIVFFVTGIVGVVIYFANAPKAPPAAAPVASSSAAN
jgi:uncharacterized membrane protein